MKEQITLRPAEERDISAFVALIRESFGFIVDKTIYGCRGIDRYILDHLHHAGFRYLVVEKAHEIVGAIEFRITPDSLFLNYIALAPSIRGKGLASLILEEAYTFLPRRNLVALDVFTHNTVAYGWYQSLGFQFRHQAAWSFITLEPNVSKTHSRAPVIEDQPEIHSRYGFSTVQWICDKQHYEVGLLGDQWIRITDKKLISDRTLLGAVATQFPQRSLFSILPPDLNSTEGVIFNPLMMSHRLEK